MSELRKVRVQHAERQSDGSIKKEDVDIYTDAEAVTMDGKKLKERVGELIDGRITELIDGAPAELDTLKEISEELQKNQSGVSTILKKLESCATTEDIPDKLSDLTADKKHMTVTEDEKDAWNNKVDKDGNKVLSTNDFTDNLKAKVDALVAQTSDKKLIYKEKKNTDFNNLTAAGFYTVQTTTNAPHSKYDYWSLIVLNSTSVDSGFYVQQIAINEKSDDKAIYVRKKASNWSSWIKLEANPDLSNYVTKIDGKGLSTNDYTKDDKRKVDSIPDNAKFTDTTYDLTPYAKKTEVPKKVSSLTNDIGFKTESEILSLIQSSSKLKKEIVTALPTTGKEDVIYLIKDTSGQTGNIYTEYLWIGGAFEVIGSTKMDLSGYAKKTDIKNLQKDLIKFGIPSKKTLILTQKEYDLLEQKDENVEYNIRTKAINVLLIANNFFAGIGTDEESMNKEPTFTKDSINTTALVNHIMENKADYKYVGSLIIPDNTLSNDNKGLLFGLIDNVIEETKPDIIIAGPTFNNVKFARSCCEAGLFIMSKFGIPVVTSIYPENEMYKKYKNLIYVLESGNSAAKMKTDMPNLIDYALKILRESYDSHNYLSKISELSIRIAELNDGYKRSLIMTQAEYNSLSDVEKSREDTLYFIKG